MSAKNELVVIPLAELLSILEDQFERFLNHGKVPHISLSGDPTKVYSRKQTAELLNRSENTITKYIRQRKLHATRLNGIYYISEQSLLNFINGSKK